MTAITARNVWLRELVLEVLTAGRMTTGEVADAIGQPRHRPDTWQALNALTNLGQVRRTCPGHTGQMWELVEPPPSRTDDLAALRALAQPLDEG